MRAALAELGQALERCCSAPVWALSGAVLESCVDELFRLRARFDALSLALVREADAQGVAAHLGATSTAAWLRDSQRVSIGTAGRLVTLAAAMDAGVPQSAQALAAGRVNLEQVGVIARAVRDLPTEHQTKGEEFLLEQAALFGPKELELLGRRLFEVVDPDQAAQREADQLARAEQRAYERRDFRLTDIGSGQVRLSGLLDTTDAAVVRAALDPLCAPRPDDPRHPAQRRADALVDVCRIAMSCESLPDNGGEPPQVVITMDLDTLRDGIGAATLDDGSPLSPTQARRMACNARIIPVVLGSAGQVLDLGRERRLFTGPLRRAIIIRDHGCAFPRCDRPPRWCDCHHIKHWIDGGETRLDNAVLLCGHHDRVIHQDQWQVRINPADGLPEFIPPSSVDPLRRAKRNTYHRRD